MIETQKLEGVVGSQLQALGHVLKEVNTQKTGRKFTVLVKRCLGRGESPRIGRSTTRASC